MSDDERTCCLCCPRPVGFYPSKAKLYIPTRGCLPGLFLKACINKYKTKRKRIWNANDLFARQFPCTGNLLLLLSVKMRQKNSTEDRSSADDDDARPLSSSRVAGPWYVHSYGYPYRTMNASILLYALVP